MKALRIIVTILFVGAVGGNYGYNTYAASKEDKTYPVIESNSDTIEVACNATEKELLEGMTASDEKDGDLTGQILIGSISNFIEKGTSNIHYIVFDADHHEAEYTRTLKYIDYESPKFALTEPLIYQDMDSIKILDRIQATDKVEGDITDRIKVTSVKRSSSKKEATVDVEVSNKFGDVQTLSLPVTIQSSKLMQIKMELSKYLIYIKKGETVKPMDYVSSVTAYDGTELKKKGVKVVSAVKSDTPGVYPITYYYEDGNQQGSTVLLVLVE